MLFQFGFVPGMGTLPQMGDRVLQMEFCNRKTIGFSPKALGQRPYAGPRGPERYRRPLDLSPAADSEGKELARKGGGMRRIGTRIRLHRGIGANRAARKRRELGNVENVRRSLKC